MRKLLYSIISIWFCIGSIVLSQNPEWITYNASNSGLPDNNIGRIAIDNEDNKWVAVFKELGDWPSLIKYDGNNCTVYDPSNSDLPLTRINCLAIDEFDIKWIGTFHGLVKFDGTNWTIYNTSNSDLPDNIINCIKIDEFDNKWIGTEEGLVKFDGTNWTVYNTSNSGLPNKYVLCIKTDDFNNKWIGAGRDLVKFNDTTWTVYAIPIPDGFYGFSPFHCINIDNSGDKWIGATSGEMGSWDGLIKFDDEDFTFFRRDNSELPGALISCITIDKMNNKWIGTYGGLAKFDGLNWNIYNTGNSGLPSNQVRCIKIDESGNKWIGSDNGLTVFNEGGIVSVEENPTLREIIPNEYLIYQNYPNPFNPITTIKYSIPKLSFVTIKIYDVLGSEIAAIVNEEKPAGNFELRWNAANLPSGVYFYQLRAGNSVETKKMILLK